MKKTLIIVGCGAALLVAGYGALIWYVRAYGFGAEQPRLYEAISPSNGNSALFLHEGALQGLNIGLYVRDQFRSETTPIFVAMIWCADDDPKFTRAVWSRDGTVIAIAGYGEAAWFCAYDFRGHQLVSADATTVSQLLQERGGTGTVAVLHADLYSGSHPIGFRARRQFRIARHGDK